MSMFVYYMCISINVSTLVDHLWIRSMFMYYMCISINVSTLVDHLWTRSMFVYYMCISINVSTLVDHLWRITSRSLKSGFISMNGERTEVLKHHFSQLYLVHGIHTRKCHLPALKNYKSRCMSYLPFAYKVKRRTSRTSNIVLIILVIYILLLYLSLLTVLFL